MAPSTTQTNSIPSKRIAAIDLDEAVAIFLVVFYHSLHLSLNFSNNADFINYLFMSFCSMGVPVFFAVNGFLLFNSNFDLKKHYKKTLRLALITILWGYLIPAIVCITTNETLSIQDYLFVGWNYKVGWNNQLWFLGVLVSIYILYPLLRITYEHNQKAVIIFAVFCLIFGLGNSLLQEIITALRFVITGNTTVMSYNFFGAFNPLQYKYGFALGYFCLGSILYMRYKQICNFQKRRFIAIPEFILMIMCIAFLAIWGWCVSKSQGKIWDPVWNGYSTVFTLFCSVLLFCICTNFNNTKNRILHQIIQTISENTLGILFIHTIYITWFNKLIVTNALLFSAVETIPGNLLYALIVLAFSTLTSMLLKQIPFIRKLL